MNGHPLGGEAKSKVFLRGANRSFAKVKVFAKWLSNWHT
jgi:hypothetical protein